MNMQNHSMRGNCTCPAGRVGRRGRFRAVVGLFVCVGLACGLSACGRKEAGGSASELVEAGWAHYRLGEFTLAQDRFRQVGAMPASVAGPMRVAALYGAATTYALQPEADPELAKQYYTDVIAAAPDDPLAAWSALGLVRMDHLKSDGSDATTEALMARYQSVADRYPNAPAGAEAALQVIALRLVLRTPDQLDAAVRQSTDALAGRAKTTPGMTAPLYALRSTAYRIRDAHEPALRDTLAALDAVEVDPQNPAPGDPTGTFQAGVRAQFDVGDFTAARAAYGQFLQRFPRDQRCFTVRLLLEDMDRVERDPATANTGTRLAVAAGTPSATAPSDATATTAPTTATTPTTTEVGR